MLRINGVAIATPKSFEVGISDLDGETNRNAQGDLLRDRIAIKRKLNCEWPPLSNSECSRLLKAVSSVFFTVEYPDPEVGAMVTKTMYVGDRTSSAYSVINGVAKWSGVKMNFVEK